MTKIKVLIVDDHPLILDGLKNLLEKEEDITVRYTCSTAYETMESLKKELVDVALLDINLPDITGIELCSKIKKEYPEVRSIALTTYSQRSYVQKMVEAGASGYLLKNADKAEILSAIKEVYSGGMYLKISETPQSLDENDISPELTPREKEVLACIARGMTNPEIAESLYVSVLTIKSHRKNLLRKFDVKNTAVLIKQAVVAGLV